MNNAIKQYSIGIDIGGKRIKAVLFDGKKNIASSKIPTPKNNQKDFFVAIDNLANSLIEEAKVKKENIKGVGAGIPGLLDSTRKIVLDAPNLPILNKISFVKKLKDVLNLPVVIDNDANCFLKAEMKMGSGKGYKNVYGIIIGTGIGGSWWLGNDINRGVNNEIEEPGKTLIDLKKEISLETKYDELTENDPTAFIDLVLKGDEKTLKNFKEIGRSIGIVLGDVVNMIDPEIIIIGGGVAKFDKFFLADVEKTMFKTIDLSKVKNKVKIVKSQIGGYTGAVGASLLIK